MVDLAFRPDPASRPSRVRCHCTYAALALLAMQRGSPVVTVGELMARCPSAGTPALLHLSVSMGILFLCISTDCLHGFWP